MINKIKILYKKIYSAINDHGILFLLNRVIFHIKEFLIIPYSIFKIKNTNYPLDESIDFSFRKLNQLIKPMQTRYEITELLKYLEKRKPKYILEIGTANGGSLFLFTKIASKDATIISIDLPEGQFGGGYPGWKIPLYNSFKSYQQKLYLIRSDSHSTKTFNEVRKIINKETFDFIFIDGDHTYDGVKKDFEMYSTLINKDSIVAFHDIVPGPEKDAGEVFKFWKEVKNAYQSKEIVEDWNQKGSGIGILEKL